MNLSGEMTFGEDVAVLIYCRTEHVTSLRLSEETDGLEMGQVERGRGK